jgi:hypothetical protein
MGVFPGPADVLSSRVGGRGDGHLRSLIVLNSATSAEGCAGWYRRLRFNHQAMNWRDCGAGSRPG